MFAFDTRERATEGKRAGEWTTAAPSELEVVRSMASCLRELKPGRWPKQKLPPARRAVRPVDPLSGARRIGGTRTPSVSPSPTFGSTGLVVRRACDGRPVP
jgi:hypothetical protein